MYCYRFKINYCFTDQQPNVILVWLTLLIFTREGLVSNLGLEISYSEVFHDFPQSVQTNAGSY
jgi:hypothetical protein